MAGYFYIGGEKMDLLVEKDGQRTYLSRYKVITTSFEESSPSVKRNNTQIQYRNGNVDFGGWNESKTIDYVGYYRADDIDEEEILREKIYALLSDPDGYYITQLKNDNDNIFERPGETSGDYFDKQLNRPSHKRFYVYANSLESELVGSYGGHVLYKISATFTTMKLPYGESVPRDLDVKPNVPYVGENLLRDTATQLSNDWHTKNTSWTSDFGTYLGSRAYKTASAWDNIRYAFSSVAPLINTTDTYTYSIYVKVTGVEPSTLSDSYAIAWYSTATSANGKQTNINTLSGNDWQRVNITFTFNTSVVDSSQIRNQSLKFEIKNNLPSGVFMYFAAPKLEKGTAATPYSPAPSDLQYNAWYTKIYYKTDNLVIPYAGTVPCSQLEQGFTVEFTAKEGGSNFKLNVNGNELTYNGQVYNGDVLKLSGYEYTKNDISIVKSTNKAYFKLIPGISNTISSNLHGSIRILGFQDLYA